MPRQPSTEPTEVELQILNVLWDRGPATVREIHNALADSRETGYSTTVKMLLVMLEKGLVKRDDSVRPQIYRAAATRKKTQRQMLNSLVRKVYEGSTRSLILQALSDRKASKEDLDEIRQLLDKLEGDES